MLLLSRASRRFDLAYLSSPYPGSLAPNLAKDSRNSPPPKALAVLRGANRARVLRGKATPPNPARLRALARDAGTQIKTVYAGPGRPATSKLLK